MINLSPKRRAGITRRLLFLFLVILGVSDYPERVATLALVGDIMLGRGVAAAHRDGGWEDTLGSIAPILRSADYAAGNLESPFDDEPPCQPPGEN